MQFNSLQFAGFFAVALAGYAVLPKKVKYLWLLAASYYFYACWNVKYAGLMLLSTALTYAAGLVLAQFPAPEPARVPIAAGIGAEEKAPETLEKAPRIRHITLAVCLAANLAILFFFKYYNFVWDNLAALFAAAGLTFGLPQLDVLLPVGISFYTLQAIGYTIDVYRGTIPAEKNFFRYALFVSFFPQLVAGPIERSEHILPQLRSLRHLNYENVVSGLLLMLWGLVQKVVIADRLGILVDRVFGASAGYGSWALAVAAVFFTFQLYCDFNSYSCIAIGAARTMGVELMENFNRPFLAVSGVDFWDRWHISLSTWLRDYIYIPLGGNRKGQPRRYLNLLLTMLLSGLWHGAAWHFVFWGLYHGVWVALSHLSRPLRDKYVALLHINRENPIHKALCRIKTFFFVCVGYVFFRAETVGQAFSMLARMAKLTGAPLQALYTLGLTQPEFWLAVASICLLMLGELAVAEGVSVSRTLAKGHAPLRWAVALAGLLALACFGVYGRGADAAQFIYFQF
ncbi:MAG: MBOAT family protein [Faecalibacterium sp.]|jgi:D-alanyl-lipoteichoic acid acyltransferase DltB (MBOAT superfamily)|nr:MBOAT family protein [Faecalibacterium sp.]